MRPKKCMTRKGKGNNARRRKEKAARRVEMGGVLHGTGLETKQLVPDLSQGTKTHSRRPESVRKTYVGYFYWDARTVEANKDRGSERLQGESDFWDFLLPDPTLLIEFDVVGGFVYLGEEEVVVIAIDDDADFAVEVAEDGYTFGYLVSKHVLIRSSAVIKTMIESKRGDATTILLIGDTDAMNIVLRIIHFHSVDDVFCLTFDEVKQAALLSDKYKWHNVLRPFSRAWLKRCAQEALEPGFEDRLCVTNVFDCDESVEDLLLVLSEQCEKLSPEGEFVERKGVRLSTALWPKSHIAKIANAR
ncbi:hypothetical protein TWF481_009885 [Arthrobotrys musiformis]|uniref:BTB domain-containing protein n=1 Tax=Arthrobotrys musiformis TaxID=47236 RepID=A0AAV9W6H4_9PEZI